MFKLNTFISTNTEASKITGYAIIQLPDLVFFVYGRIKKLKCFRSIATSNIIKVLGQNASDEESATVVVQEINSPETQNDLQRRDLSRLSKLENDNDKLFKKLDDIEAANNQLFETLHDMTVAIDRINDLNPTGLSKVKVNNKELCITNHKKVFRRSSSKKEY